MPVVRLRTWHKGRVKRNMESVKSRSLNFSYFATPMALLALRQTQGWAPLLSWSIPSLQSLLELFPPFLLAVPKSKVSHSRKAMRSANKGLKDKQSTRVPKASSYILIIISFLTVDNRYH